MSELVAIHAACLVVGAFAAGVITCEIMQRHCECSACYQHRGSR